MNVIAKFEKVSFEQFKKDWIKLFPEDNKETVVEHIYRNIKSPRRATKGSAGYDFFTPVGLNIKPSGTMTIPTGIRCKIDDGWVLQCYPRSGQGFKYRLQLDNTVGIIDSDYYNSDNEGHIMLKITNDTRHNKVFEIDAGKGIMQGIFVPYGITVDDEVEAERNGGFGSTEV